MTKKRTIKYHDTLIQALKDPKEAAEYLNSALEEGEPELFLLALRNVAEAFGGMSKLSKKSKLNRETLYRMLSKKGNPALDSLTSLLKALGLKINVQIEGRPS